MTVGSQEPDGYSPLLLRGVALKAPRRSNLMQPGSIFVQNLSARGGRAPRWKTRGQDNCKTSLQQHHLARLYRLEAVVLKTFRLDAVEVDA